MRSAHISPARGNEGARNENDVKRQKKIDSKRVFYKCSDPDSNPVCVPAPKPQR
jgi:hypothetical protein